MSQGSGGQNSAPWKAIHEIRHFPEKNGVKIAKVVAIQTNGEKDFLTAEESPTGGTRTQITIVLSPEDEAILGLRLLERAKQRPYVKTGQGNGAK